MEEFRIIKDYPKYEVSNHGNVRNKKTGRILQLQVDLKGYLYAHIRGYNIDKKCKVHRLVALVFIDNPEKKAQVDHIDGNRKNNHVSNLRFVSNQENGMNKKIMKNNTSGITGIYFHEKSNKWKSLIRVNKILIYLGNFDSKQDAIHARKKAQDLYFGEFQKFNSKLERLHFQFNQLMKKVDQLLNDIKIYSPIN